MDNSELMSLVPFIILFLIIHFLAWLINKYTKIKHSLNNIVKILLHFYDKKYRPRVLNRADFLVASLVHQNLIIFSLFIIIFFALVIKLPQMLIIIFAVPLVIYIIYVGIGINLMRLHDVNLSGFYLFAYIISSAIFGVMGNLEERSNFNIFDLLHLIITLPYLYIILFKKSVESNNKFL